MWVEQSVLDFAKRMIPGCNVGQIRDMVRNAAPYTQDNPKCNRRYMGYAFLVEDDGIKAMYEISDFEPKRPSRDRSKPFDKTNQTATINRVKTGCRECEYTGVIIVFDDEGDGTETKREIPCECRRSHHAEHKFKATPVRR